MKGFGVEAILFVASLVLCLVCAIAWIKRDDSAFKRMADTADDVKINVSSVESQQFKLKEEQQNFVANTTTALGDLVGRVKALEERSGDKNINLNLKEPVRFSVVYKTVLPELPTSIKSKTPLLDKSGVTRATRMSQ